jgi:hypothetical protein
LQIPVCVSPLKVYTRVGQSKRRVATTARRLQTTDVFNQELQQTMKEEDTDGQIMLVSLHQTDPIDIDEVAAAVAAVEHDAANMHNVDDATIEAVVNEEASVLISEAAAGKDARVFEYIQFYTTHGLIIVLLLFQLFYAPNKYNQLPLQLQ